MKNSVYGVSFGAVDLFTKEGVYRGDITIEQIKDDFINYNRPYELEKKDLQDNINFGVISKYFAKCCLDSFKDQEHKEALKTNEMMNNED